MPRPRKNRMLPSLATFVEEAIRALTDHLDRRVEELAVGLRAEMRRLAQEVRASRRAVRAAGARRQPGRPPSARPCSVRGCGKPHLARGLCKNHYQQVRYAEQRARAGRTVKPRAPLPPLAVVPGSAATPPDSP